MTFFKCLLFLIGIIVSGHETSVNRQEPNSVRKIVQYILDNVDDLVENFLAKFKAELTATENYQGIKKLNDVDTTVEIRVWPLPVTAKVSFYGGEFRNLLTAIQMIPPTAKHVLTKNQRSKVVIGAHIGLEVLEMSFDNVEVYYMLNTVSGATEVTVGDNSVYIEVVIDLNPCKVTITQFRVEMFSGLKVNFKGFNTFNLLGKILTKTIKSEVNSIARDNYHNYFFMFMEGEILNNTVCSMLAKV